MTTAPTASPSRAVSMTENRLLGAVRYLAKLYGWRFYHTHDSRRSDPGYPDLTLVHAGQQRVIFAELKTATGRTTPEQDAWLADLTAAGAEAYLWRPADLERVIPALLRGPAVSENRARPDHARSAAAVENRGLSDRGRKPEGDVSVTGNGDRSNRDRIGRGRRNQSRREGVS